jgi:hypothetical protein
MTALNHIEILQRDVEDWKKRALKAELELRQMAIAYEDLREFEQKARELLKTCHDRDYDGQGYGLTDRDRADIVELIGEEPSQTDEYGEKTYTIQRWKLLK